MSDDITVYGYRVNTPNWNRDKNYERDPLVHIIGHVDCGGDIQSISFHPKYAEDFCKAIMKAAKHALRNGKDVTKRIDLPHVSES